MMKGATKTVVRRAVRKVRSIVSLAFEVSNILSDTPGT